MHRRRWHKPRQIVDVKDEHSGLSLYHEVICAVMNTTSTATVTASDVECARSMQPQRSMLRLADNPCRCRKYDCWTRKPPRPHPRQWSALRLSNLWHQRGECYPQRVDRAVARCVCRRRVCCRWHGWTTNPLQSAIWTRAAVKGLHCLTRMCHLRLRFPQARSR